MYLGDVPMFDDLPVPTDIGTAATFQGYGVMQNPDVGTVMRFPVDPSTTYDQGAVVSAVAAVPSLFGIPLTQQNLIIAAIVAYILLR